MTLAERAEVLSKALFEQLPSTDAKLIIEQALRDLVEDCVGVLERDANGMRDNLLSPPVRRLLRDLITGIRREVGQ